jgi:propanol-preferring alcohol dehydrogenase
VEWGAPPEFREIDVPTPAADEVLIKVAGVGLCHSDFLFLDTPPGIIPWELPFTLGHETAGWVEQLGADVDDLELGQPVAVAGIHSCGRCQYCLRGQDNYCPRGASGRGYGEDAGKLA